MNRLIMGMILVLGAIYFIGGYYSIANEEASKNASLNASAGNSDKEISRDFRTAVDQDTYLAKEGDQKYYLQFESENTGWTGTTTFLLPDGCEFVYGFDLDGDKIKMTYIGNTCGAEGANATMQIRKDGSIATILQGQKFIFNKN